MEGKEEKIKPIVEAIAMHRQLETQHLLRPDKNLAIGLSNVRYFGQEMKIWLTTKENTGGVEYVQDITGSKNGTRTGHPTTITNNGQVVNKNTRLGEILILNPKGTFPVPTPHGTQPIEIHNLSSYTPDPHNPEALDLVIHLGIKNVRRYRKLTELIEGFKHSDKVLQELEAEESRIRQETDELAEREKEIEAIAKRIDDEKAEREKALAEVQSFVRQSAELRYQPILDPWQEEVKRSHIFTSSMAINGGPGTGKTTALIQRIKFLIDREAMLGSPDSDAQFQMEGYFPNMTETQKRRLFGSDRNWVFFTPNELLKLFLKNNMSQEGLKADDSRLLIWKDYLNRLIRDYNLVNTDTQNPFLFLRGRTDEALLPYKANELKQLLQDFEKLFLKTLNDRLQALISLDIQQYSWKQRGLSIQNYINRQEKEYSVEGLLRLYFNLQETFSSEVKEEVNTYNELLKKETARILHQLKTDPATLTNVEVFAENWMKSALNTDEEVDEDEEDQPIEIGSLEPFIFSKLRTMLRTLALAKYDKGVRLNKKLQELNTLIKPVVSVENYESFDKLGQSAYFEKYFTRITKGIVANVLSEIPRVYKTFRKQELGLKQNKWNYALLNYLVEDESSKNKRLHPEEQSLLIYFINSVIAKSHKVSKLKSKEINHAYFEGFRIHSVPVIGVDEATDFHIIDLLAMHSLGDLEISSVTFSGDIMQRLTKNGIRDWSELRKVIKPFEVKELYVSYRQSPTLLDIASALYKRATGIEAEYMSYMDKDPKEPKPLYFRSNDEKEKIQWIADRILDIYKAYGSRTIPSIAVFLASDEDVELFANKLREIDRLADVGINVRASKDGQVLGDRNMVRVFPIDYIKGMEFEAAFFHNLHELKGQSVSEEMIIKNLYVGLSRASFYMAVTTDTDSSDFRFLEEYFNTEELNWR